MRKAGINTAGAAALLALGMAAGHRVAPEEQPWRDAYVMSVYDGDTYTASVDLGFQTVIVEDFRLLGIDTPEVTGEGKERGMEVRDYVQAMMEGRMIQLREHGQEKYGRWLAETRVDGRDLTEHLIRQKMGVRYDGGKRGE